MKMSPVKDSKINNRSHKINSLVRCEGAGPTRLSHTFIVYNACMIYVHNLQYICVHICIKHVHGH